MDQRGLISLEVKKGDNTFVFLMPIGAPLGEAYDAAFECLQEILGMSQRAAEQAKPAQEPELMS